MIFSQAIDQVSNQVSDAIQFRCVLQNAGEADVEIIDKMRLAGFTQAEIDAAFAQGCPVVMSPAQIAPVTTAPPVPAPMAEKGSVMPVLILGGVLAGLVGTILYFSRAK